MGALSSAWRSARTARALSADRKSTRLNSSHANISYAVFCLKKKKRKLRQQQKINHVDHLLSTAPEDHKGGNHTWAQACSGGQSARTHLNQHRAVHPNQPRRG